MATLEELLANEPSWVVPGTERYNELQRQADERGFVENLQEGFAQTALSSGLDLLEQEAMPIIAEQVGEGNEFNLSSAPTRFATYAAVLVGGKRAGGQEDYIDEHYDSLIEGIPSQYHEEIFQGDNLEAAQRARARIMSQLERGRRIGNEFGFSDNLAIFAGGLVDVDLPLMAVTGGGFKAATVAGRALTASRAIGLSPRAALRVSSAATGVNAGLQAGIAVGAADAAWTETRGWTAIAETALASALLGGVGDTVLRGDRALAVQRARSELHEQIARDDPSLTASPDVDGSTISPLDSSPSNPGYTSDLASIVREPTQSTVNFPERDITAKSTEQLAASDETAARITQLRGFSAFEQRIQGQSVEKIAGGQEKVVLRVGGFVVRLSATAPVYGIDPRVLKPTHAGFIDDLYVEVVPEVKMDLSVDEIVNFNNSVQKPGDVFWSDAAIGNLGRTLDGEIAIIDGVVLPVDRFHSGFSKPVDGRQYPYTVQDGDTFTPPDIEQHPLFLETTTKSALPNDGSLSASRTATRPMLTDPAGPISDTSFGYIENARTWREDSGWLGQKIADDEEWWTSVAMSGLFNVSTSNFRSLYRSNSAVLNWMAGNIFESPHGLGRGRFTAAAGMEFYHRRIVSPISRTVQTEAKQWARRNNTTWQGSGYGITTDGVYQFNRQVMLELNDRAMGRTTSRDPSVQRAADAYEQAGNQALRVARGGAGQKPVDGFDAIPDRRGYTPYIWKGQQLLDLEAQGVVKRKDVIDAMAIAYRTAGIAATKDAEAVAQAVVARAVAKDLDVDTNLINLLSGDGREFLQEALRRNGMSDADVEALIERLTGSVEERGKESFAKSRNEIDLNQRVTTQDGSDVRIVDLLDNDMHGVWQRYARRMAGSAALARVGITNRAQRETLIQAAQAEQRALGEEVVDADLLRAMLSNFDGGPVHGYFRNALNEGVGAEIAIAKRITNLALLGKLGFAQLAETGATMAATGLETWWRRGPAAVFDKALQDGNQELLDDMAYMLGDLGYDHLHFAEWLDLDDVSRADRGDWIAATSRLTAKGQFVQGYTSMFNQVRGFQQRTAAMGMVDKVLRTVDAGVPDDMARRFQSDLGLDADDLAALKQLIQSGVIEMGERNGRKFVNRLNFEKWDTEFAEVFASSITRNINQVVQRSMAGEQDAWMHTHWGAIMTHLKTFPLQAMQKQFVRNLRHSDNQALATVMMGAATALAAISVRDAIDGKERTTAERAKMAFGYSNITGWVPMFYDPTMTALGLEDYRINAYGPHSDYTPPIVNQINRTARLPGAIIDTATGNADWYDRQSLKALPFANTLGLHRMLD